MWDRIQFELTAHVLERYRERVAAGASFMDVLRAVRESRPQDEKTALHLYALGTFPRDVRKVHTRTKGVAFILVAETPSRARIITCGPPDVDFARFCVDTRDAS